MNRFIVKTLSILTFTLPMIACAPMEETSSEEGLIRISTPCQMDSDCPAGWECEIEEEHGETVSFCKGHGGSNGGGSDDSSDDSSGEVGDSCTSDDDCGNGFECEQEFEHGQVFSSCKPHGHKNAMLTTGASSQLQPVAPELPGLAKSVDVFGTTVCSAGVKAKFKAGPRDPNQIKSNVQIDDVAVGIVWIIKVYDGAQISTVKPTTAGASGSINVDRFTTNNAGADKVTFKARRADNSATCSGSVTVP